MKWDESELMWDKAKMGRTTTKRSMGTSTIDAHHHMWRYSAAEYEWIDGPLTEIQRDFLAGGSSA